MKTLNLVTILVISLISSAYSVVPVRVQLKIREENVTSLLANLLQNDYYAVVNEDITTKELFAVLKVNQSTFDDYTKILTLSNISVTNIDLEPLRDYIPIIYNDFKNVYGEFIVETTLPIMGISKEEFDVADKTKMLELIKTANWTVVLDRYRESVYMLIVQELSKLPISVFLNLIRPFDPVKFLENALLTRNVTFADLRNGTLGDMLKRASRTRIATAVSPNNFVTTRGLYHDDFFEIQFENQNISIRNITFHDQYINITTNGTGGLITRVADTYDSRLKNCLYNEINVSKGLSYDKHGVLMLTKGDNRFELGAPLICDEKLYGLAEEETDRQISFVTFVNKSGVNAGCKFSPSIVGMLCFIVALVYQL